MRLKEHRARGKTENSFLIVSIVCMFRCLNCGRRKLALNSWESFYYAALCLFPSVSPYMHWNSHTNILYLFKRKTTAINNTNLHGNRSLQFKTPPLPLVAFRRCNYEHSPHVQSGRHTTASLHTYKYECWRLGGGGGCMFVLLCVRGKGAEWK
jgi:hypothetical protein